MAAPGPAASQPQHITQPALQPRSEPSTNKQQQHWGKWQQRQRGRHSWHCCGSGSRRGRCGGAIACVSLTGCLPSQPVHCAAVAGCAALPMLLICWSFGWRCRGLCFQPLPPCMPPLICSSGCRCSLYVAAAAGAAGRSWRQRQRPNFGFFRRGGGYPYHLWQATLW